MAAQGEVLIDEAWGRRFDSPHAGEHDDGSRVAFDPEQGWREQPLTWTRSFGADASGVRMSDEAELQKKAKSDYRAALTVPPEVEPPLAAFLAVQTKQMSVTEAAKLVGPPQPLPEPDAPWPEWLAFKELAQKPAGRRPSWSPR
ncbi:MAG: hypothetical protein IPJ65_34545 [Archangiaceae bacterium]|nr:hypothetical protein [Archangiaceae bacterium]